MATDWSGEYAPDKDRSARLAARDFTLDVALADADRRTDGAAVGSCHKDLDAVAKGGVVVDSGKHDNPLRESLAAELGEGWRVPSASALLSEWLRPSLSRHSVKPAKIYVSLTN
jgi:hypothetical protein